MPVGNTRCPTDRRSDAVLGLCDAHDTSPERGWAVLRRIHLDAARTVRPRFAWGR